MKTDMTHLLSKPFSNPAYAETETQSRLGVHVPGVGRLATQIREDLSTTSPYGIRWWMPAVRSAPRILVGDYLLCCTNSIATHLTAAGLHWYEFVATQEHKIVATTGAVPGPSESPLEWLTTHGAVATIHQDGVLRALSSALDCLSGAIVGVCALPRSIKMAGFNKVRKLANKHSARDRAAQRDVSCLVREEFLCGLDAAIESCGPSGWIDWMLHYRNMLVHRGRRLELSEIEPCSDLLNPAQQIALWSVKNRMARNPSLSDIEAILAAESPGDVLLPENTRITIKGLIESTTELIAFVTDSLLRVWTQRRESPASVLQPYELQWTPAEAEETTNFEGYVGSDRADPALFVGSSTLRTRILAAALDDSRRSIWDDPDMAQYVPGKSAIA